MKKMNFFLMLAMLVGLSFQGNAQSSPYEGKGMYAFGPTKAINLVEGSLGPTYQSGRLKMYGISSSLGYLWITKKRFGLKGTFGGERLAGKSEYADITQYNLFASAGGFLFFRPMKNKKLLFTGGGNIGFHNTFHQKTELSGARYRKFEGVTPFGELEIVGRYAFHPDAYIGVELSSRHLLGETDSILDSSEEEFGNTNSHSLSVTLGYRFGKKVEGWYSIEKTTGHNFGWSFWVYILSKPSQAEA